MEINAKKLKSILTLSDYESIENALGLRIYSASQNATVFYNADKYKDPSKQSPKLYRYNDTKIYISYTKACSYDIIGLVQAVKTTQGEACSFIDAINFILTITGIDPNACQRLTKKNVYDWETELGKYLKIKHGEADLKIYDSEIINQLPKIYPEEWIDEGISIETMAKYQIGYYPRLQATTIPCFNKTGDLVGLRCRHWLPEEIDKGKYKPLPLLNGLTYTFKTNKLLFGINYNWAEIERTSTAIVVESEKAVMKLDTWYHEKNVAVGMFGNNLGALQKKELLQLGVTRIIYVVDNDWIGKDDEFFKTWQNEINKFIRQWKGYAQVEIVWDNLGLLGPKENATDRTKDVWDKLYESREIIS